MLADDRPPRAATAASAVRPSTSRSSSTARARCPGTSCASPSGRRGGHRPPPDRRPVQRRRLRRRRRHRHRVDPRLRRVPARRGRATSLDRGPREHESRRRLAAWLRAARPAPAREWREPVSALDGRPGQRRRDRPDRAGDPCRRTAGAGRSTTTFGVGNDFDERLLGARRRRRRPFLLHRRRAADP